MKNLFWDIIVPIIIACIFFIGLRMFYNSGVDFRYYQGMGTGTLLCLGSTVWMAVYLHAKYNKK